MTSPRSGAISGLAAAAERVAATDAKVVYCKPLVSEGAAVVGSDDALPDWLLDVMATDATADAALKHVMSIADGLDVPKYVA